MKKAVVFVDDPSLQSAVEQTLASAKGMQVSFVGSEQEAIKSIDSTTILVTDLLGAEDGIKFLNRICQHNGSKSAAPVVVLTLPGNDQLAVRALREGAASYVPGRLVDSELIGTLDSVYRVASDHHNRSRVVECLTKWKTEFTLDNDPSLIGPLVRYLQESTQRMGLLCESAEETRLGIALEEALLNGMYHGNLEVSSKLREEDDVAFYKQVEQRRIHPPYCDRRINVRVSICRKEAVFEIKDDGPGFDISSVPDPTDPGNVERVCGRGMLLMRTFMDELQYNAVGNEVRMVKRRQSCDPS